MYTIDYVKYESWHIVGVVMEKVMMLQNIVHREIQWGASPPIIDIFFKIKASWNEEKPRKEKKKFDKGDSKLKTSTSKL